MAAIPSAFIARIAALLGGLAAGDEIEEFKNMLMGIAGDVEVAGDELLESQGEGIQDWLGELMGLLYDVDDFVDRRCIAREIQWLKERLAKLLTKKPQLPVAAVSRRSACRSPPSDEPGSGAAVGDSIKNDALRLVDLLTHDGGGPQLYVIVGPGGIGKTTLAHQVFDSVRMRDAFDIRIWMNLGSAGDKLSSIVDGKRLFLVLDDVPDEHAWKKSSLRSALRTADRRSRVLATTRNGNAAARMAPAYTHRMRPMGLDGGWFLLRRSAGLSAGAAQLEEIGKRIVVQCGGLPLAIRVAGGALRFTEPSRAEWKKMQEDEAWVFKDKAALRIGYGSLSPELKQCFLYCSLFPPDSPVPRRVATEHWISDGLVADGAGGVAMQELVERGLLNADCTMHGMLRALCRSVARRGSSGVLRRVSMADRGMTEAPPELAQLEHLRALLLSKNPLREQDLDAILAALRRLRVLDLADTAVECVPDAVGRLEHLRFLNLSRTRITELPGSIEELRNLQFLLLQGCSLLRSLPSGIGRLRRLRSLDLAGTTLQSTPCLLRELKELTFLHGFVAQHADTGDGWSLKELSDLQCLESLQMTRLERVECADDAAEARLWEKQRLRELELNWGIVSHSYLTDEQLEKMMYVAEELCPPVSLSSLTIVDYFGRELPPWMSASCLVNLRRLELVGCMFCETLPPLGRLPELQSLTIKGSFALETIGPELVGGESASFPKLEELHLKHLIGLRTWTGFGRSALPALRRLRLERCPALRSLPGGLEHATALTSLHVISSASLEVIEQLPAVEELVVKDNGKLERIGDLPSLRDLDVENCDGLRTVEGAESLLSVRLSGGKLPSVPGWVGVHAPRLARLEMKGSVELLRRCAAGEWSLLRDVQRVYASSDDGKAYFSYGKRPFSFATNLPGLAVPRPAASPAARAALAPSPTSFAVLLVALIPALPFAVALALFLLPAFIFFLALSLCCRRCYGSAVSEVSKLMTARAAGVTALD